MMTPEDAGEGMRLLHQALHAARDTRRLVIGEGAIRQVPSCFRDVFGDRPLVVVADPRTFEAAGRAVLAACSTEGLTGGAPFLFGEDVHADVDHAARLQAALESTEAIPVAVGSGTINDLTKLAAHRAGRPYLCVATAASMDGYTAFGASLTDRGSKQTFDCPAPRAVIADLRVIAEAPPGMNASGYADLLAKNAAGADWMLADACGEEPIDPSVWNSVQQRLRVWTGDPAGVATGNAESLANLLTGLMMGGFAMQAHRTSRPASGAEHQFSHLWDMQHHAFQGVAPSHGFKVGIGTLASVALYEFLIASDLEETDIDRTVAAWPSFEAVERRIRDLLGDGPLCNKAIEESRAKHPTSERLRGQLTLLRDAWPDLRSRLARHLIPFDDVRRMLREAGCPDGPEAIGISRDRLRRSFDQASYIRRRFTVLDVARRFGVFDRAMERLFGPDGRFGPPKHS